MRSLKNLIKPDKRIILKGSLRSLGRFPPELTQSIAILQSDPDNWPRVEKILKFLSNQILEDKHFT